jgi:hypothetical protein
MPFVKPRLQGIYEHLGRVQLLFALAQQISDAQTKYRLLIISVYSCRAITEIMLEAAEKQEVRGFTNRKALEIQIESKIPFYFLIERIRIHDFHRFGLVPPDPNFKQVMLRGKIEMIAQKGEVLMSVSPEGYQVETTGNSRIKLQRPLLTKDDEFFDDELQQYVSIEQVLKIYIENIPTIISEFEALLA